MEANIFLSSLLISLTALFLLCIAIVMFGWLFEDSFQYVYWLY